MLFVAIVVAGTKLVAITSFAIHDCRFSQSSAKLGSKNYDVEVQGQINCGDLNFQTFARFWAQKAVLVVVVIVI